MQFGDSEARPYPRSPAAKPSPALQEAMAPGTTAAVSTPFIPSFNFLAFNGSHMERQPTHRPLLQGPFLPGNIVIQASHLQNREGMEQCGARPQGLRAVLRDFWVFPSTPPAQRDLESVTLGPCWAGMASRVLRTYQSRDGGALDIWRLSSSAETYLRPRPS